MSKARGARFLIVGPALLAPALAFAQSPSPCTEAASTREADQCISDHIDQAERELQKYLNRSREVVGSDSAALADLDKAQSLWVSYREAHCGSVYLRWRHGTIRGQMSGRCMLRLTERRTHDLWQDYLTFLERTDPPLLPEPVTPRDER